MPKGFKKKEVSSSVYIVNHDRNGKKIPLRKLKSLIKETEKFFLNTFGGHTSVDSLQGEFITKDKRILKEGVYKIVSFADVKKFKKSQEKLKKWLIKIRKELNQESIALEFEGDMYYI